MYHVYKFSVTGSEPIARQLMQFEEVKKYHTLHSQTGHISTQSFSILEALLHVVKRLKQNRVRRSDWLAQMDKPGLVSFKLKVKQTLTKPPVLFRIY